MIRRPPTSPLFPYTTLFRSGLTTTQATVSDRLAVGPGAAFLVTSAGAIEAATGITSSGTITFTGLEPVTAGTFKNVRSEEHTSELQSHVNLVCRLLLEKKKT